MRLLPDQPESFLPREGLPYWTFWFLLCIILLLIAFIFLRDKSLRQRLNLFFSRAKRRMVKIRLQARLKREVQKKEELLRELGKATWQEGIRIQQAEKITKDLKKLENQTQASQKELGELDAKIETLSRQLIEHYEKHEVQIKEREAETKPFKEKITEIKEKAGMIDVVLIEKQKEIEEAEKPLESAEKELRNIHADHDLPAEEKKNRLNELKKRIKDFEKKKDKSHKELRTLREEKSGLEKEAARLQEKVSELERKIKKIEKDRKEQTRKFQKEIKEWEKDKSRTGKKIEELEKQKEPLFTDLGKFVDEFRVDNKKLTLFYSKIDRASKRIRDIERDIQNL